MLCGVTFRVLIFFMELSCRECNSNLCNIIVGYMDSRCLSTAALVKEVDSLFDNLNGVAYNPNHFKVLRCQLSNMSNHLEHWQNAARKMKSWTVRNKESEQIRRPLSQTGWLITKVDVQHVWRTMKKKIQVP